MFKTTQDNEDWLKRTGSHANRPFANGRIDDLPSWAQEPEEYFNSLRQQYEMKMDCIKVAHKLVLELKTAKGTHPLKSVQQRYDVALSELATLQKEAQLLKQLAHGASTNAWGMVFYVCCKELLDRDLFAKIEQEVTTILRRKRKPIEDAPYLGRKIIKNRIGTLRKALDDRNWVAVK